MTIKIERDAVLCVINNNRNDESTSSLCHKSLKDSPLLSDDCLKLERLNDFLPQAGYFRETDAPELDDTDDESSISSSVSSCSTAKGVRFADPLVTEVRYRPRTLRKHVTSLFYTVEETQRFRQEYREERRLKSQEDDSTTLINSSTSTTGEPGLESQSQGTDCTTRNPHRISRVVVLHKNIRETFFDGEIDISHRPSFDRGECKMASGDFFDNDSFWSGQITWY